MTMFGVDAREVTGLIQTLRGEQASEAAVESAFARAAWSGISEPGDRVAGELVAACGASLALTAVVERWSVERLGAQLGARGLEIAASDLSAGLARWQPRLSATNTMVALRQAARLQVRLLLPGDALWPSGVDDLGAHAPLALWARGTPGAIAAIEHSIALVGARAATGYGEHVTMEAAAGLIDRGFAIVSGAAYGIDGMAHRSALASDGVTVAFLAGGVDRFYPAGHDALLSRMVERGAVLTELPPGAQPSKWRFLQRNRLIAAASQATVVLEAGWRSGSLNTAAHAAALGRAVGAVPGPVTSPASAGCHRLIREFDAVCVTNPAEMAELVPGPDDTGLGAGERGARADRGSGDSPETIRVLDALSRRSPRRTEDVAARAGLSLSAAQVQLGLLDLDGRAVERERGWVRTA